ncbi:hypothetical protein MTR67_045329 [Solanum verrucosum]|uniref:S-protein homolog n=1 Tax=Solanum verrucosum TaxID=315347 RepID=A0AAF0UV27_SOLVR|nr:hypothetical protein MTR67_045329 [Solanum verrucosum]
MNSFKHNFFFFSFIFLLNLVIIKSSSLTPKLESHWWTPGFEVHINSSLPINSNPLKFRCKSADDDLGDIVLRTNEEFKFHFNEHFLGGTLYFCHFYWDSKDTSHDIFNDKIADKCGLESGFFLSECYWKVQEDGFYFSGRQNGEFKQMYTWQ